MSADLGLVEIFGAEAVGQPGQRRFRLFARNRRGSAIMWMEKEQLHHLSLIVDRFLAQLTEGQVLRTEAQAGGLSISASTMPADFPLSPDYDFQVAELRINYEERRALFRLEAVPLEIILEPEPQARMREDDAIAFLFTQSQAQAMTSTIAAIVPAGRPVCPLCGTPLDGTPHACVRQNGHREIVPIVEEDEEA